MENTTKKRIIIGEDEPLILEHLKNVVKSFGYEVVASGKTEAEILSVINKHEADVILLDINLGGKHEGITIGRYIKQNVNKPFIYVTAHSDTYTLHKALDTQPSSYIIKPFKKTDIYIAIELALSSFDPDKGDKLLPDTNTTRENIMIRVKGSIVKVTLRDVLYAKAEGNYTMLYSIKGKYLLRGNLLETIENYLNHDFIRVHKSFAVQIDKVTSVSQNHVMLGTEEIPLGRTFKEALLERMGK